MKITKKASGKTEIRISKSEWKAIGKKAGWVPSLICPTCGDTEIGIKTDEHGAYAECKKCGELFPLDDWTRARAS